MEQDNNTKQNVISKMWNKTVFPDMIKRSKEKKELMTKIKHQAEMEAIQELGPELKEKIKKEKLEKLSETKKDKLEKFAKAFSMGGNTDDKLNRMLGTNNNNSNNPTDNILGNMGFNNSGGVSNEKLLNALGQNSNNKNSKKR